MCAHFVMKYVIVHHFLLILFLNIFFFSYIFIFKCMLPNNNNNVALYCVGLISNNIYFNHLLDASVYSSSCAYRKIYILNLNKIHLKKKLYWILFSFCLFFVVVAVIFLYLFYILFYFLFVFDHLLFIFSRCDTSRKIRLSSFSFVFVSISSMQLNFSHQYRRTLMT